MLARMAARKLQIKLLGTKTPVKRSMSYAEFRNLERLVKARPSGSTSNFTVFH